MRTENIGNFTKHLFFIDAFSSNQAHLPVLGDDIWNSMI